MKKVLTVSETAQQLQLCRQTVYKLIMSGDLEAKKMPGKWLIIAESVDRYLQSDNIHIESLLRA